MQSARVFVSVLAEMGFVQHICVFFARVQV